MLLYNDEWVHGELVDTAYYCSRSKFETKILDIQVKLIRSGVTVLSFACLKDSISLRGKDRKTFYYHERKEDKTYDNPQGQNVYNCSYNDNLCCY